ncbi:MAG: NfeD family protein [Lachnospiraceae bacterium]|nr:NfeD family protein [Lachnospiraceae bacterium]HCJ07798.1 NfeD family protein [Lachnospiraceae bacterium]
MEALCWLLLAALFIVLEIISLGLTTIWFAGGAFIAALAALAGVNLSIQVALFLVVSIILLVLTRPIAIRYLDSKTQKTNSEALIGQKAIVLQTINNLTAEGQVKVNGMEWTARAKTEETIIPEGEVVTILEIQGVKLIVEPVSQEETNAEGQE